MKKWVNCYNNKGDILTLVFDKRNYNRLSKKGFLTKLVTNEELLNTYLATKHLKRYVEPTSAQSEQIKFAGLGKNFVNVDGKKTVICVDHKGNKWVVCDDPDIAAWQASVYMEHLFSAIQERNEINEKRVRKGYFMSQYFEDQYGEVHDYIYFVGPVLYVDFDTKLETYLSIHELNEIDDLTR